MTQLFRNKDLVFSILIQLLLTSIFFIVFTQLSNPLFLTMVYSLLMMLTNTFFYIRRFRSIAKLNQYLRELQFDTKQTSIPFDQLLEGELAILKNELFKLSVTREQQNQWLNKEKQQMSQSLSDISHQLKTPLTSLILLLDILNDPTLSEEERQKILFQTRKQTHKMKLLVSVLLKMARLESGEVKLIKQNVNVAQLINQSLEPLTILKELHSVDIQMDIGVETLMCDPTWTAEALTNILKNAIEHSTSDSTIYVSVNKDTLGYCMAITNTGEGMSNKQLERIFDRFYKLPSSKADSIGIGLSFAKHIIERQHGYIRATSQQNQTTFSIYLPFYSSESPNSHITKVR